ncbi:MAG: DedA family protein [Gammaproteobacteria bacterium]|nr:DedA family protein [Gammaproteobacteria bacterium]
MRLFAPLYDQTLRWARHSRAPWALSILSFVESVIFPIPTDVMLAPMVLAQPSKWLHYAALATVFSVLGGIFGYLLGAWAFDWASSWLMTGDGASAFAEAQRLFQEWGVWFVFMAAFTPIPYKVFTISAGFMALALVPFIIASAAGRAARFFLVAGLVRWVGARYEPMLRRHIEFSGWLVVAILVLIFVFREWL